LDLTILLHEPLSSIDVINKPSGDPKVADDRGEMHLTQSRQLIHECEGLAEERVACLEATTVRYQTGYLSGLREELKMSNTNGVSNVYARDM
jgi:hypothetical protein